MVALKIKQSSNVITYLLIFPNKTLKEKTLQETKDFINTNMLHCPYELTAKHIEVSSRTAYGYGCDRIAVMSNPIPVYSYQHRNTRTVINLTESTRFPKLIKKKSNIDINYSDTIYRITIMKAKSLNIYKKLSLLANNSFILDAVHISFFNILEYITREDIVYS